MKIQKGAKATKYIVWYFDHRGAWRELDESTTEERARAVIASEKLDKWYIEKRTREIIDLEVAEHEKRGNHAHRRGGKA